MAASFWQILFASKVMVLVHLCTPQPLAVGRNGSVSREFQDINVQAIFACPEPGQVVIVNERRPDFPMLSMICGTPLICGRLFTCIPTASTTCSQPGEYVTAVTETSTGVASKCCAYDLLAHQAREHCYTYEVNNFIDSPNNTVTKSPALPLRTTARPLTATRRPAIRPPPSSNEGVHYNIDLFTAKLRVKSASPTEAVKSIIKVPNQGWSVMVCSTTCDTTTTPKTSTARTERPTPPPSHGEESALGALSGTSQVDKPSGSSSGSSEFSCNPTAAQVAEWTKTYHEQGQTIKDIGTDLCSDGLAVCNAQCLEVNGQRHVSANCAKLHDDCVAKCVCISRDDNPNERPPESPNPPIVGHPPPGATGCFSAAVLVTTPSGPRRMDTLREGDHVLVALEDTFGQVTTAFQPIRWFIHREVRTQMNFLTLITELGRTLSLTAKHLVPIVACDQPLLDGALTYSARFDQSAVFAERVKIGDCLIVQDGRNMLVDKVTFISETTKIGVFSPVTQAGNLIVNDVHVSCYSSIENHFVLRTAFNFLLECYDHISSLTSFVSAKASPLQDNTTLLDVKLPTVLRVMLNMSKWFFPLY